MDTKIAIETLDLYYSEFHALKNINMRIPEKEITAFIGPSGCGKSTVLKLLLGWLPKYQGFIHFDGKNE